MLRQHHVLDVHPMSDSMELAEAVPIVNIRVISPLREGFGSAKLCEVSRK